MFREMPRRFGAIIISWATLAAGTASKAAEPVNPDLIPEARQVLEYLQSVQGKKILTAISGCQDARPQAVLHITGREPAISGNDVAGFHRKWEKTYHQVLQATVDDAIRWWRDKGGLVTLHYHWMKPGDPEGSAWVGRPKGATRLDLAKAVRPGTDEHRAVMEDLKVTADYLQQLADARVPVLWRPFHEIDGGWFWWTDPEKPDNTAALWRLLFDYLVKERKLHNLIWLYNAAHVSHTRKPPAANFDEDVAHRKRYYPGAAYVDLASIDSYANPKLGWGTPQDDTRRRAYELMQQIAPGKMLAIAEDSALLNPDIAQRDGPAWVYCLAWWAGGKSNPPDWMRKTFHHDHLLTLDELPLLVQGNVAPNVRISEPADGAVAGLRPSHGAGPQVSQSGGDLTVGRAAGSETRADRAGWDVPLSGFAGDRNANLKRVSIHALGGPWRNWFLRSDADVAKVFEQSTLLGEARLTPDGRWTFTWSNVPTGFHNVVAFATDSDGLVACSNVVRLTAGLENLARGGKATASTTSQHGDPAAAAIDGDPNTMWWSDHEQPGPQWLMVDLGSVRKVGGAMAAWWKAYAKNYKVEVSTDGQTWREVAAVQGRNNWLGDADVFRFEPVEARYVRLHCTEPAVTWQSYTVFELGVYEAIGRR